MRWMHQAGHWYIRIRSARNMSDDFTALPQGQHTSKGLSSTLDILYCASNFNLWTCHGTTSWHTSKFCEAARGLVRRRLQPLPVSTQILRRKLSDQWKKVWKFILLSASTPDVRMFIKTWEIYENQISSQQRDTYISIVHRLMSQWAWCQRQEGYKLYDTKIRCALWAKCWRTIGFDKWAKCVEEPPMTV